ncbi:hypothetical protein G6F70_006014 [Rhizopus microsporus]|nr:hypothetical protein G6F71_000940 [Rhizopus microsporus]KAG1198176.1 hypothetical protein G6F70_006014 [Rhizopus microsporus]KAG1215362.1 hypothetical protein G6F69_001111 [Rhizopus microsporus]KAG1238687.1 hypothetical protein G6F67_000272 [Rhizopus microsporus]KAG1269089.1 hypothetical protein G6F68_000581 [Rhizopus microsporus]
MAQEGPLPTPTLETDTAEEFLSNRLDIVKRWQEKAKLSQSTAQYLTRSTRKSISDNYNRHWKNWAAWCLSRNPKNDPLHYDPPLVSARRSPRYIESYNAQEPSLGNHALIQQFFKAKKKTRSKLPNRNQEIFDIDSILVLVENWGYYQGLALRQTPEEDANNFNNCNHVAAEV